MNTTSFIPIRILVIGITTFVLTYLAVTICIWLYSFNTSSGLAIKDRLTTYAKKYNNQLKNDIFSTTFNQAAVCNTMQKENLREICRKEVRIKLGDSIREEELADVRGYSWPNDLFFVKQTGDIFTQLGWDGELKNISSGVQKQLLQDNQPTTSLLFRRNCTYFQIASGANACEIYETIRLSNASKGYIIRLYPFEEEGEILFALFMPLIGLTALSDIGKVEYFGVEQVLYIIFALVSIITPFILTFIVVTQYRKQQQVRK